MVAELTALRDQIDDVDKALLNLSLLPGTWLPKSRRGAVPFWPALFTCRSVRPSMLASHRKRKQKRSVSHPDLIEDVLRRVRVNLTQRKMISVFKTLCPSSASVVIVGGGGQMGRLFEKMLTLSGHQVRILEQQDWPRAVDIVADAGMVIVSADSCY